MLFIYLLFSVIVIRFGSSLTNLLALKIILLLMKLSVTDGH